MPDISLCCVPFCCSLSYSIRTVGKPSSIISRRESSPQKDSKRCRCLSFVEAGRGIRIGSSRLSKYLMRDIAKEKSLAASNALAPSLKRNTRLVTFFYSLMSLIYATRDNSRGYRNITPRPRVYPGTGWSWDNSCG